MGTAKRTATKRSTTTATARRGVGKVKVPPRVAVVVNEAMRARYEKHLADFKRAQAAEIARWDEAYEALGEILDGKPPLYLAGGYRSAKAFVAAVLPGTKLETVRAGVRVARHFDPDAEKKHGVTRLALLLDYLAAQNGGELPAGRVDPDRAKVVTKSGTKPFATMSFDELRDAVRAAKGARARRASDDPEVRALRAVFAKHGLGNVSVVLREGRWTFGRVEGRQFGDLATAFSKAARSR